MLAEGSRSLQPRGGHSCRQRAREARDLAGSGTRCAVRIKWMSRKIYTLEVGVKAAGRRVLASRSLW